VSGMWCVCVVCVMRVCGVSVCVSGMWCVCVLCVFVGGVCVCGV